MTQILNYEFPDFDYALPTIEGFEDSSWHNDICPSLTRRHKTDETKTIILWCDYADPAMREMGNKRYTLIQGEYGSTDDQVTLCESDDLADILAAIPPAPATPVSAPAIPVSAPKDRLMTLNTLDGTLDRFVQAYCLAANIRLDGDAFGVMFSGKENYTTAGASALIEQGANAYSLRLESLYDILTNRVSVYEARHGKAGTADVIEIADALFRERKVTPEWFIETGIDREGNDTWEVSICHDGEVLLNDIFFSREEAEMYIRAFSTIALDGE